MDADDDEAQRMRSAALQNAQSIFLARQRAQEELLEAKEALERKTEESDQQREWFRVTLSSIGDAVVTTDIHGNVTFLNGVAESLTGWRSAEALGQPLAKIFLIVHERTRTQAENPVERVLREGVVVGLANHTALIAKDGSETSIEDSAAPIRDAIGNIVGAVMVFHDVTARRRAERELRESEVRLNLALAAGRMGAWEWVLASGEVSWTPTLEAIHGSSPGVFSGRLEDSFLDLHPEDRDRVLAAIHESVERRGEHHLEYRIIKPDRTVCWLEARGSVFLDDHGNPERVIGICTDITPRKKAEEALRKSEEFNRSIIESSRDCTKTLSLEGVLLWISDVAQELLCVGDVRDVLGKSWIDLWKTEDRASAAAAVRAASSGGTGAFVGWYSVLGQPRCWDVVITPIRDRFGKPEMLLAVSRDITERRKLDEAASRLAAVVEFSDDAIITKTLSGIITTWNRGAERIFGYTAEEAVGQPVTLLIPPNRANEEPAIIRRIAKGESVTPYETIRVRKDGSLLDISLTVSPIKDRNGAVIGASKIARDITARKRAEAERARLNGILESSLNEIYIFSAETLRFQYVNHGAQRNLGYSMDELRRMTPLDLEPDYDEASFRIMVETLLREGKEKLVFYAVHRRADASLYPVEVHLQSVASGGDVVFLAVILDITERKKAEEERERLLALEKTARARAEEAQFRAKFLAEASAALASTQDYEVTLRDIAAKATPLIADWCAMHLLEKSGEIRLVAMANGDPAKLAVADELRERYPSLPDAPSGVPAVIRSGKPQIVHDITDDLLVKGARDADHLSMLRTLGLRSAITVPMLANQRTLGAITLIWAESGRHYTDADLPFAEDLAARAATAAESARLYQELRQANAAKDHFMAVLSHELRTPLNPVLMTVSDLEQDDSLPEATRAHMTVVRRNVELEARLIDDLLDSTRISTGKLALHRVIVDATELIHRALTIVEGEARAKGVRLEAVTCPEPCPVDADPARLQQVIWNVVKNAVKFTSPGGWVRLHSEAKAARLRIVIADNGIGIERDHLGKIFNAFEQGDTRIGHAFGGLGLGLAISKALVTLHGGSLTAESAGRGQGATFIVELPLAAQAVHRISGPSHAEPMLRRALRLLVVEDHPATAKIMVRLLTKRGYTVSSASSIAEALEVLEKTEVDLLVTDVGLPDGSGRELMEKVRQTRDLPGIALSGYGTEADLAQSSAVGFRVHLTKPVNIDQLDHEVQLLAREIEARTLE